MGIGGPCSAYGEWIPYSQYPAEPCQALFNGCSNSSVSVMITPSSPSVLVTVTPSPALHMFIPLKQCHSCLHSLELVMCESIEQPMAAFTASSNYTLYA